MPSAWPHSKSTVTRQPSTQSTQQCIRPDSEVADEQLNTEIVNELQQGLPHIAPPVVRSRPVIKYDPLWEWSREQLTFTNQILGQSACSVCVCELFARFINSCVNGQFLLQVEDILVLCWKQKRHIPLSIQRLPERLLSKW